MLAEQGSSIELRLPEEIRHTARVLAGEMAWPASDALKAVAWLTRNGSAVVGVELWREQEGYPLWLATSDYSPSVHDPMTPERVSWCADKAAEFIQDYRCEPGALFNLTWDDNAE